MNTLFRRCGSKLVAVSVVRGGTAAAGEPFCCAAIAAMALIAAKNVLDASEG